LEDELKTEQKIELHIEQRERKKTAPRSAFGPNNPYRVQPGQVLNPRGGKPKDEHRLVSKALKVQLNTRAPDAVTQTLHLSRGSSWAQCLAARLMIQAAVKGDVSAANAVIAATEGRRAFSEFVDASASEQPTEIQICFVESDGNGRPRVYPTIEAMLEKNETKTLPDEVE
jgi:hypothetical protein